MSSSAKTGKALAHRIAVANRAHAISGVLLNIGKLLCTVAVICAVALAGGGGLAIAVAVAISAVAAVAYLAVTGVSIRDLYKSWQQVIQVKEEGLVTVQSLQPVLTPITPIAGKIGNGKIAKAAEGGKVAVEDAGTSWGTKEGAAAKIADAGVKVAKDSAKVGAKIAKGGVVTGAVGGLVLGSVAGNVAQAAAQTLEAQAAAKAAAQAAALEVFKEVAKAAVAGNVGQGSVRVTVEAAAQASVGGGGLAGLIEALGGAGEVASVTGALGPQGAEILGLLTGAAGGAIVGAVLSLLVGLAIASGALGAVGGLLVAGVIAKPPYPKT